MSPAPPEPSSAPGSPSDGISIVDAGPRTIGRSGLVSGPLAFGCWRYTTDDLEEAESLLRAALDLGMNLVDTADVYGLDHGGAGFGAAEELLGRVLNRSPELRERIVLATKGGIVPPVPYDSGAGHLRAACEASLRRLGTDAIDLYQLHRPDLFTHPAEVAETLAALQAEGKIREVGVSNMAPSQVDALAAHLGHPPATVQPELSLLHLDPLWDGTLDQCLRDGVVPLAWSPLAGGRLATDAHAELTPLLDRLAAREGVDRSAIALAFVLAHPSRPVAIVGSQRPERLEAATTALGVHLTRSDAYDLIEAATGEPLP